MSNQTLRSLNILFKLFLSIFLFKYCSAAPVNSSVTYNTFMEEIIRNKCTFPSAVTLPFTSKDTFDYLGEPLQICKAPETGKRYREAIRLCSEIFDTLKNVTCHPQTVQLPKIEVSFSENVCKDINTLTFPKGTESLLKHLNDSLICELMCDAEFLPACTVLLWSYEVQKQIEDAKTSSKLLDNEATEKPIVETKKKVEKPTYEETKQDKVPLLNVGNSKQDGKHPDNKPTTIQENEQHNEIPDNTELTTIPAVNNKQDDKLPDNPKQSTIQDDNNKQNSLAIDNNQPVAPNDAEMKILTEPNKNINGEKINRNPKNEDLITKDDMQIQSTSNSQQNHQVMGEKAKLSLNNKQNSELEGQKTSAIDYVTIKGNKSVLQNEIIVSGILPKHDENTEHPQKLNTKISKEKEPDMSNQEKSEIVKTNIEPQKEIFSPTTNNHNVTQVDGNTEVGLKKPDLSKEKETDVPQKKVKDQITVEVVDSKAVTNSEILSTTEKSVIQSKPAPPKTDEEISENVQVAETVLNELPPPTTVADLEKMENENEIPEANKDQDSYNDLENEGDFSKLDYDGDDGFFEPPKSKKNEILYPPKLSDGVIENQNDLSKYPIFPARNSVGQSDDIQVIPAFPEQEDSHFFFYFLTIVVILMAGYLIFHNKQKIIALIVEGRHERRRRSHGVGYKKLDTK